jgi:hypothetical protein
MMIFVALPKHFGVYEMMRLRFGEMYCMPYTNNRIAACDVDYSAHFPLFLQKQIE